MRDSMTINSYSEMKGYKRNAAKGKKRMCLYHYY